MATIKKEATKKLMKRVYNNKLIEADVENNILGDEAEIKAVINKVFGDGSANPDPSLLHQFNQLVVEQADELILPKVTDLLSLISNFKPVARGTIVMVELPKKIKAKVIWSANGSGVDLIRVEGKTKQLAIPATFTAGFYYEPLELVTDSINTFRALINDIGEAKLRLYMIEISALIATAVASGDIPANNVLSGSNNSIADYNKLVSRASRFGGTPNLIADSVMIDDLAGKINGDTDLTKLISDQYKDELLLALNVTRLGRSTAFNLINPFTDVDNTTVELDVQEGYMIAGEGAKKPITVVQYGGLRQLTDQDMEDERIKVKIAQDASILLVHTQNFFYLKDTALTL